MTARASLLIFALAPTIALSQAAWAQPISLTPAPIVATPIPPPIPVVTAPAVVLPPPVTEALLPGHWQLEGARYVWVPPETRLRPVQLRPLLLVENVWKDGTVGVRAHPLCGSVAMGIEDRDCLVFDERLGLSEDVKSDLAGMVFGPVPHVLVTFSYHVPLTGRLDR